MLISSTEQLHDRMDIYWSDWQSQNLVQCNNDPQQVYTDLDTDNIIGGNSSEPFINTGMKCFHIALNERTQSE